MKRRQSSKGYGCGPAPTRFGALIGAAAVALVVTAVVFAMLSDPRQSASNESQLPGLAAQTAPASPARALGTWIRETVPAPIDESTGTPVARADTARDLHAVLAAALKTQDVRALEEASTALHRCLHYQSDADALKIAFAGGTPGKLIGALTIERQQASEELGRRCHGFSRLAVTELDVIKRQLASRLQAHGSRLAERLQAESSRLPDSMVIDLLSEGSAASFERSRPALTAALARWAKVQEESELHQDIEVALLLASCDLGRDCSSKSFEALRRCTYQGLCAQGLFDHWKAMVPPVRVDAISRLRHHIVNAVLTKNFAQLGLE